VDRIAFYITSFEGGGAERNTALIASELARGGHAVLLVVDRDTGPNRALLDPSIEVAVLPRGYLARIRSLRARLIAWRADAVFARLGLCPIIATLAQGLRPRWRTVISYHNPYEPDTYLGVKLSWWLIAVLSRLTAASFGVSQDIADQLVRYGARRDRTHVIHNPVALDWVRGRMSDPVARALPTRRPYLISVGRLVPQKGYRDLIAAFALIADEVEEDLVILGEGPLETELRAQIAAAGLGERVHLAGYATNPFPYYAGARLFVLASHWEGFGNVIVEALACGTPVVATRCPGGPKDILDGGAYGALVPVGDPAALAQAILQSLAEPSDPEQLTRRAQDFDLPKVAATYARIISVRQR